ncbi:ribulose-phosphate 3-epimerase [Fimbriiglobus ruber]|uniref:Ribulose-phosphate 3-epimerase n=1 Tax=Fimbriiglobus ruber TaxID=1908690 RepID=A0A225EGY0_9BACT|nr:ribulose-phosphate 3-epimerase [Fimbriiglobus ruber]OWK47457.1 Ribulose-phosphate 3-epimerase [Fimbriiglobus ruber]
MTAIAPSILAADFSRLGDLVREVDRAGADRIHIDVMDGHFVPNLSMGSVVVKGLRPVTQKSLEVHLMVQDPGKFLEGFLTAGADRVIFHLEVEPDPRPLISRIHQAGKKAGLAFNPDKPVDEIAPFLGLVDLALCMTVFPGFGGQAFISSSIDRVRQLRELIKTHNPTCDLEVDGGIDAVTAPGVVAAGANVLVAGTAIFGAKDGPTAAVKHLADLAAHAAKSWA